MATTRKPALGVGDPAPDFTAHDETGRSWSLKALKGRTVVLYFYPKDNTPGCTVEARDFRDHFDSFTKKRVALLGVSPDSAKSHAGFKAKNALPFPLLVDEDKALCRVYGVWRRKTVSGRTFMGVQRSTFVIGPDGLIRQAVRKVSVSGHAEAVLQSV